MTAALRLVLIAAITAATFAPVAAQAQSPVDITPRPTPATLPSDDEIMRTIYEVTSRGPRRVGTPGGDFAVDYVRGKFKDYGMTGVHVEETPTYAWEAVRHGLKVDGQVIDSSPVTYSMSASRTAVGTQATPAGGLTAPLIDVGFGTAAEVQKQDVNGKIVMFDLKFLLPLAGLVPFTEFFWDPDNTLITSPTTLIGANPFITTFTDAAKAAIDGGAVGFVGVLEDYFDSNKYYNEFYRKFVPTIPGLWVTRKDGARMREALAANPAAKATLDMETRRWKANAHAVVGYLEGKSKDAVMVQTHHDSGYTGAVEDGSGVGEVMALAKHYSAQPAASREKSMMFVTFDSHWSGYMAHFAFVKRHITHRDPAKEPHRIVANVTLEHIAKYASRGADGALVVSDLPEPRGIFENMAPSLKTVMAEAIVRNDLRRATLLNGTVFQPVGIPTDASAVLAGGVPTASLISGPLYLYDAADTYDKVAKDELQKVAKAFVEITDAIDETPSDQIGIVSPVLADPIGTFVLDNAGGEKGTEESTDRVESAPIRGCVPATSGRAVLAAKLRRVGRYTRLTFRTARAGKVRIVVRHRSGRRVTLHKLRRIRACRAYRVRLPGTVVGARVTAPGGRVTLKRR